MARDPLRVTLAELLRPREDAPDRGLIPGVTLRAIALSSPMPQHKDPPVDTLIFHTQEQLDTLKAAAAREDGGGLPFPEEDWEIEEEPDDGPAAVPYERFQRVNAKLKDALSQISDLEGKVGELGKSAGTVEALSATVADLKGQLKVQSRGHQEQIALMGLGITDTEGQDLARFYHGRLDEKGRPPLAVWLKTLSEKPEDAPKGLQAFLPQAEAEATEEAPTDVGTTPATPTWTPPQNGTHRQTTATPSSHSADAILSASPEAWADMRKQWE